MSGQTDTPPQFGAVQQFTLTDDKNTTKIIFTPGASDPSASPAAKGPSLQYSGSVSVGDGVYSGSQVGLQEIGLGVLVGVVLLRSDRAGRRISFTVLLPPIKGDAGSVQEFDTVAIQARTASPLLSEEQQGPQVTYVILQMTGTAVLAP
jgi:hypothetical protein